MKPSRKSPAKPSDKLRKSPEFDTLNLLTPASHVLSEAIRAESVRLTRDAQKHEIFGQITAVADTIGISRDHVARTAAGDDPADATFARRLSTGCGAVTGVTVDRSDPDAVALDFTLQDEDGERHTYEVVIRKTTPEV